MNEEPIEQLNMDALVYQPNKRLIPSERESLTQLAQLAGVSVDYYIDAILRKAISTSVLDGKLAAIVKPAKEGTK